MTEFRTKFLKEMGAFNEIVEVVSTQLLDDFCSESTISPVKYMKIKKTTEVDLLREMDNVSKDVLRINFQIMSDAKKNGGTVGDFTSNLMNVFANRMDELFETKLDLVKMTRVAEVLYDVKLDENSEEREVVMEVIDKIAEAKVDVSTEFICALANRLSGLKMVV